MRIIDLSHTVSAEMSGVSISPAKSLKNDGWNATTLSMYSHCGTHVDAPVHFGVGEEGIDQMSLDRFVADAWVVDCRPLGSSDLLDVAVVESLEDKVQEGDGLILRTGWSARISQDDYRNALPRISKSLAEWMVSRKIKLVGVEPPSVADVNNIEEVTQIHQILLTGGVTIIEGLTNLESISSEKVMIMALPLKIKNGDGCPVRAVAIESL